jgi:hypothetical protein
MMVDDVDICPHCGADAMESATCAMNGCPFGAYESASAKIMRESKTHRSDCAIYNEPALPAGKCDCGVAKREAGPSGESGT